MNHFLYASIRILFVFVSFMPVVFTQTTQHATLWTKTSGVLKLSSKHSVELEYIYRRQSDFEQNTINPIAKDWIVAGRIWYYYQPIKTLTFIGSPISVWKNKGLISQIQDYQKPVQRELRTLLGIEIKHSFGKKIEFSQRNLLDFRLTRPIGTKEYSEKNRIRAKFGLKYALNSKLGLTVADEYFLIFGKDIAAKNHFDQNRIIGSINYKFSPNLKMDIGYMLVHQKRKNIDVFDEINSTFINVSYLFEYKKRDK